MDMEEAKALALRLMLRHGLIKHGWRFAFNNSKTALGLCAYRKRTIYLSKYFISLLKADEIEDTIKHEIAHALDAVRHGSSSGHGERWKAIAREIGPILRGLSRVRLSISGLTC